MCGEKNIAFGQHTLKGSVTFAARIGFHAAAAGLDIADVDMDSTSIQFAYTMGSMSIKGYQTDTDNPGWDNDAQSHEVTEIAVNFAF